MGNVQEAIRQAMQTEKNAMDFYELGARQMKDPGAKRLFEQLAKEEREHAAHFFRAYTGASVGTFDEFISAPPQFASTWITSMEQVSEDFTEQKALEAALEKEGNLEKALWETAAKLNDQDVKEIFELNARETHNHYLTIEAEYSRIMAMVDESDMDTFVRE